MTQIQIKNGDEAIAQLGATRLARRKALIQKREPKGEVEKVQTSWGAQEAHRGVDYVAIQDDGSEYPYKIALWQENMEEVLEQRGFFRKKVPSRLIEVPEGVLVTCVTIDGGAEKPLEITAPDFIAVGTANEVYPLARTRFDKEFEWI